jgi:WD40 repeat protein
MSVVADRCRWRAAALVAVVALLGALIAASSTRANELDYRGCTTSARSLGPSGSGACTRIPRSAGAFTAIALSPDGRSLYSAGYVDGSTYAIARFDRDPTTGALTYRGCITDHAGAGNCDVIPGANGSDPVRPLYGVRGIAISPDGDSVYAVGYYAIARFDRNSTNGTLAYHGCISGATRSGVHSCQKIPTATLDGNGSGMGFPTALAVSPDGGSVYVTSPVTPDAIEGDGAVTRFDRDPGGGALTWRGCISGDTELGPDGSGACTLIPSASRDALDSGLNPESLSMSPDGKSLYTGSSRGCGDQETGCVGSWGLARFDRDPATGALAYRGCVTGNKESGPSGSGACAAIPGAHLYERGPGLIGNALAISSDGKSLYAGRGATVARLDRNVTTGTIKYRGCITGRKLLGPSGSGDCALTPGATKYGRYSDLDEVQALATSPNGKSLYAGGSNEAIRLRRDPGTGALSLRDCVTGDIRSGPSGSGSCRTIRGATKTGNGSGLGRWDVAVAASEDGRSLYMASGRPSRIARLGFAPQTRISKARTRGHRAAFHFRAGARSTFECKLRGRHVKPRLRRWRHCGSDELRRRGTVRYRKLGRGKKAFRVRATEAAGNTDPTPAKRRWRVGS